MDLNRCAERLGEYLGARAAAVLNRCGLRAGDVLIAGVVGLAVYGITGEADIGDAEYAHYLGSTAWRMLRGQVVARAAQSGGGIALCERCHDRIGIDVHHLTYKHFGAERLNEVLLVCKKCHGHIHAQPW